MQASEAKPKKRHKTVSEMLASTIQAKIRKSDQRDLRQFKNKANRATKGQTDRRVLIGDSSTYHLHATKGWRG